MVFTSRRGGRSHGRSHLLSCRLVGSGHVRRAHGRVRSCMGQRRSRERRRGEAGLVERHNGHRRSDVAEGSHRGAGHHDGVAAVRSGRRAGRRSSEAEESDGGSRHGEGCSREEDHDGHSSRRQAGHRGRDHRSHGRGSLESGSGNGAHVGGGSRIAAVHC